MGAQTCEMSEVGTLADTTPFLSTSVPHRQSSKFIHKSSMEQDDDAEVDNLRNALQKHPLGVRPSGNALTADQDLALSMGIFGRIPDALLLLLLEYLDQGDLLRLSHTSKGLFAYATYDQFWRELCVSRPDQEFSWRGSWRSSLLKIPAQLPKIDCQYLFSDALYRPFQCANVCLTTFSSGIPPKNQIPRLKDLDLKSFTSDWSNKPFILTEPVKDWRAYREWDETNLLERFGDIKFRAEAVEWSLRNYVDYMNDNKDESPLYLFDRAFVQKMELKVGETGAYEIPECFAEDLFTLLGEHRPDHSWLIIGPERSGSTFHKDPNATSAWNAVIRGSKYWIMFPNSVTPPGVYVSDDQSEVTSPLSIAEWLLTFHSEARRIPGCFEGVCGTGEVLHVPSGWWHLVVNLESAIAITQNFVPRSHLSSAVNFLRHKPDQVSGFRSTIQNPYALFMDKLHNQHPDLHVMMEEKGERKRKWEEVVASQDDNGGDRAGFSFGFGDDIGDEE